MLQITSKKAALNYIKDLIYLLKEYKLCHLYTKYNDDALKALDKLHDVFEPNNNNDIAKLSRVIKPNPMQDKYKPLLKNAPTKFTNSNSTTNCMKSMPQR